ncbi:MAG: hypothetical protein V7L04_14060 [Nostoc sp.]|uniref:hypothetical protein n=1 Tax=Nostoc sp. TaxID=1180 RepID=UPI002FF5AB36
MKKNSVTVSGYAQENEFNTDIMAQQSLSGNPDTSVQSSTRKDLSAINPLNVEVPNGTYVNAKEVERILQILKEGGNLPDIIVTPEDILISGINALEAAKRIGQTLVLVSVQKVKTELLLIRLDVIKLDGGTQSRACINQQIIEEYAQVWREGAKFPPVVVFYDGTDYWLADGFHRCISAGIALILEIQADVRQGTRRDAVLYSVGANGNHGLRRTNEDKRRAVTNMLNDQEWQKWSDRAIAEQCGVSNAFVGKIRGELGLSVNGEQIEPLRERTVTRGGTTYSQKTRLKDKPWTPQVTERVEIIGGEHEGKFAEVRVITGNAAMCLLDGDEENKRRTIFLSYIKPLEKDPPPTTAHTSVKQELKQIQKEAGFGTRSQLFPDLARNEGPPVEWQSATITNLNTTGDVLVTEVVIALMRLSPEQINEAMRKASANWNTGQIEAAYQALNEHRRIAA